MSFPHDWSRSEKILEETLSLVFGPFSGLEAGPSLRYEEALFGLFPPGPLAPLPPSPPL